MATALFGSGCCISECPLKPSITSRIFDWRPPTPFYYGWLVLAMGSLSTGAGSSVSQVVLGTIQIYIIEDTGWSLSTLSLAVTAGTWCSGILAPFAGRLADRYGPRPLMTIGLIVVAGALFALSTVSTSTLWQFFAAYIIGRAISNPFLIGLVPRTATVNFFRRRRNITLSIAGMSRPIGGAINIQIISLVAVSHGWRASYGYLAVFMLILAVPVFFIMRRSPEEIGLLPDGARPVPNPTLSGNAPADRRAPVPPPPELAPEFSWTVREAMRTRAYWCIAGTAMFAIVASAGSGYILVPFLVSESGPGLSNPQAAGVGSLGAVLAMTTLVWGFLADKFGPRQCMVLTITGAVLSQLFLMTAVDSLLTAYAFAILWGFFSNTVGTLEHMLLAQYFGRGSFGAILGSLGPMQTTALGVAPIFGTFLYTTTDSYTVVFSVLAAMYTVSGLLIFFAKAPKLPPRALENPTAQTGPVAL